MIDLENAPRTVPKVRGIYWLKRNLKIDRSLKWAEILGSSLIIVILAGGLALYAWVRIQAGENPGEEVQKTLHDLGYIFLLSGLLLIALVPLFRQSLKTLMHRLGTDGKCLYVRLHDGREITVPPAELAFTNRAILYQKHFLPLQTGQQQNLYEEGEIETWIVPLLHQAVKLSPIEGLKHQWRHRNALLIWPLIGAIALGLLLILVSQLDV